MTASSDLLILVISMVWACLQVPGVQNKLFKELFFNLDVVADLASAASLTFCPGLLDVLQSAAPPTVDWFKRLPADYKGKWGVYVLVMEKRGCKSRLYCGSATDSDGGIGSRWALYDRHNIKLRMKTDGLPRGVLKAFQDGFKITHKGLLVTAPMASPADVPMYRLLFYAMEATFTFAFWMMDTKKHYFYHKLCPWSLDTFQYDGFCSHSALNDPIARRFDLSSEELTTLAADNNERRRAYARAYRGARFAEDPEGYLAAQRENAARWRARAREADREGFYAKQQTYIDTYKENHSGAVAAIHAKSEKKIKELGIYPGCDLCGVDPFKSEWESDRHQRSKRHKANVKDQLNGVVKPYKCFICSYSTKVKDSLRRHKDGEHHKRKVREAQASSSSSSSST